MPEPLMAGAVKPPADMLAAARKTLGDRYEDFIAKYGENFTPQQLVDYHEGRIS